MSNSAKVGLTVPTKRPATLPPVMGRALVDLMQGMLLRAKGGNTDVVSDICIIRGLDSTHFEQYRIFLDLQLLKRRNAIAHGQQEFIHADEIDELVENTLALMIAFRNLIENKVYTKAYAA